MDNIVYLIHESSYVDDNVEIGEGTEIGRFCHIQSGAVIGKNCFVGENVNISNNVRIGDRCIIQNNVSLYEGLVLESDVFCGTSAVFTNDLTPRAEHPKGRENYKKTLLKKGASVGANATIVCGITIGEWAMVEVASVVVNDVPPHALVVGVPARQIGWVCKCGRKLVNGKCEECRKEYMLEDNQ